MYQFLIIAYLFTLVACIGNRSASEYAESDLFTGDTSNGPGLTAESPNPGDSTRRSVRLWQDLLRVANADTSFVLLDVTCTPRGLVGHMQIFAT